MLIRVATITTIIIITQRVTVKTIATTQIQMEVRIKIRMEMIM
jgi:hypothetical protein